MCDKEVQASCEESLGIAVDTHSSCTNATHVNDGADESSKKNGETKSEELTKKKNETAETNNENVTKQHNDGKTRKEDVVKNRNECKTKCEHQEAANITLSVSNKAPKLIHLNVGGVHYTTTLSTLTKYPSSMLGAMFTSDLKPTVLDETGRYFIDRDGCTFQHILNFLRSGQLTLAEDFANYQQLRVEADYYQISPLVDAVEAAYSEYVNAKNKRRDHESGDFIEIRETHYGRAKDYREQMERVHMIFIGKWCYINEFHVFLQSSRLADGTEGLPGVQCMIYGDYCEMSWTSEEQYFRIKLGDYLSRMAWKLHESSATASACDYYNYRTNTKVDGAIQKIFRDKWFKPHSKQ